MDAAALQTRIAAQVSALGEVVTMTSYTGGGTYTITALVSVMTSAEATPYMGSGQVSAATKPIWGFLMDGLQTELPAEGDTTTYSGETLNVINVFDQLLGGLRMTRLVLADQS